LATKNLDTIATLKTAVKHGRYQTRTFVNREHRRWSHDIENTLIVTMHCRKLWRQQYS